MSSHERTARLFARYEHSTDGHLGSAEEWTRTVQELFGAPSLDKHLETLGFTKLPSKAELRKRYRELMLDNHPDRGGCTKQAAEINEAYTKLLEKLESQ
jgi:DnaJ-domain-containing protein 1